MIMSKIPGVIAITGPTASGKSSIAMELAQRLGGEIISGDSMQIYVGMDIGTAKPTAFDMKLVKHHLFDELDIFDRFSVSDYCLRAAEAVLDVQKRNHVPIICGGTGQYIQWFLQGIKLTDVPSDYDLRRKLEIEYDELGALVLHSRLKSFDEKSAEAIHPNNKKRLIRAIEIYMLTGKTKTYHDEESLKTSPPFPYEIFTLEHDRDILYDRVNKRVDIMRELGLTKEVKTLWEKGIESTPTASQAIGYKEFFPYFKGEITEDEVYSDIAQGTRNYAKRQITFFKRIIERKVVKIHTLHNMVEYGVEEILKNSEIIKSYD